MDTARHRLGGEGVAALSLDFDTLTGAYAEVGSGVAATKAALAELTVQVR
jgi:hypothetical protein